MEKARIRTGWKNRQRDISPAEFANALSSICWRMSLNAARNLHQQDFVYRHDHQRLGVIREYLIFLMHCADRLAYEYFDTTQRNHFMQALALDCQRHVRENTTDITHGAERGDDFIRQANGRMQEYGNTAFHEGTPGYGMYRLLGTRIQAHMGHDQVNRWVIDQVMEIDAPEVFAIFRKSMEKLKRNAAI